MIEVTARLKERFCKDCNIPIRLFQEPYFSERLKLYDRFFGTLEKYKVFLDGLERYSSEQEYFEEYNAVKDAAIGYIKNSEGYIAFNSADMNGYRVKNINLPSKDIFKPSNDGKSFISVDMRKANFSSLHHYASDIFCGAETWEQFIGGFTSNHHIVNSKYIRQVILGNCNPKRHITYEKYLMDQVLTSINTNIDSDLEIVFFSNDELIFDVSGLNSDEIIRLSENLRRYTDELDIPLKVKPFKLYSIKGTDGYIEVMYGSNDIDFKCLNNYVYPFVLRELLGEDVQESDKVFYHEGLLAKFIEVPKIEVNLNE